MRPLGKSDIMVSSLAVGCWSFGGGEYWGVQSQRDANDVVARALDEEINFFDTAAMYNNGESEKSLGEALRGRRHQAVLCTKVGPHNAYRNELMQQCGMSLKRLGTDYIDVYMLHWPINPVSVRHFTLDPQKIANPPTIVEAFSAMMELKRQGKIRLIGISNFGVKQMQEALATGAEIAVNQMPYNIFTRAIEQCVQPFCVENGISLTYSITLMQGLLTGKYRTADEVPHNQAHSRHYHHDRGQGTSRHGGTGAETEMFVALDELRQLAADAGLTLAQMAIAWTLVRPGSTAALAGCRSVEQLEENIVATRVRLDDATVSAIDRISQPVLDKLGNDLDYYEAADNSRIY